VKDLKPRTVRKRRELHKAQSRCQTAPLTEAAAPAWWECQTKVGARMERNAAVRETEGQPCVLLMPLTREARFDITGTETLLAQERTAKASKLLVSGPQARLARLRRSANFFIASNEERSIVGIPYLVTKEAEILIVHPDRFVPQERLVEMVPAEIASAHDLGLQRLLVA
jgi:hypothetical protein